MKLKRKFKKKNSRFILGTKIKFFYFLKFLGHLSKKFLFLGPKINLLTSCENFIKMSIVSQDKKKIKNKNKKIANSRAF